MLLEFSQKLNVMNILPDGLEKDEMVIELKASKKTIDRLNRELFKATYGDDKDCPDTDLIDVTSNGFHFRYVVDEKKEQDSE